MSGAQAPFIVSFRARHPTMKADALANAVGFSPDVSWTVGEPRKTPKGRLLRGVRDATYIACSLPPSLSQDLGVALVPPMDALADRSEELRGLAADGAEFELYVTINTEPRGVVVSPLLMEKLAALKVGLGLDGF